MPETHARVGRARPRRGERWWWTPAEVAKALQVSSDSVERWIAEGRMRAELTGQRSWHVTTDEVRAVASWRAAHPGEVPPVVDPGPA